MRFVGNNAYLLPDCGEFQVYCGLATVYRKDIDFSLDIEDNSYWLCRPDEIYYKDNHVDSYGGKCMELYSFYYKKEDKASMIESARDSIKRIKRYTFDKFDEIDSLDKAIKYFERYRSNLLYMGERNDCERYLPKYEGLLYIKTNNRDDLSEWYDRACRREYAKTISPKTGYKMDHYEKYCKEIEEIRLGRIACRDRILNTPSLYEEVMQELDKRREHNVEKLKSFGVEI